MEPASKERSGAQRATGSVLLTGATGFLGAHVLWDLLHHSDASVTCLVRGASDSAAEQALLGQLAWYFPELDLARLQERVHVARGDLDAPNLGLAAASYERLAENTRVVLNVAANVHHVTAASRSFRTNAEGVSALIAFARRGMPKELHHASTVSVQGAFEGVPRLRAFKESHLEEGQVFPGPYPESKFRAEVLVRRAFAEGVSGAVYRVGHVGPHALTGRYQRNIQQSNTARYVRACIRLGFAPYWREDSVRLTPVDGVARALVLLMTRADNRAGQTYYIDSPQRLSPYDIVRILHAAGYSVRLMAAQEFAEKASVLSQDMESLSVLVPSPLDAHAHAIATDSSWSQRELAKVGFTYPKLTS
ncbi:MAG TPA: SDR family oxidoreductase, partial [Polyangiales bacterium]|nr:SDR family oxidoreductase [Polyangiales bacterium]